MKSFWWICVWALVVIPFFCITTLMPLAQSQTDRVEDAKRQLEKNPCDLNSLGILTYQSSLDLNAGQNPRPSIDNLNEYSTRGLRCLEESGSGVQAGDINRKFLIFFNAGAGFAALETKDYNRAESYLRASVDDDPSDLQNVYRLAVAYLQATPPQSVEGLFFLARAVTLAQKGSLVQKQIQKYAIRVYQNYHGSKEGWDNVLHTARKNGTTRWIHHQQEQLEPADCD